MNSTTNTLSNYLANIQTKMIQSLLTTMLVIGNLSNVANILVFSQNSLRSHICSWYFIGASIGHLLYLDLGCLTRVIPAWTQYDLSLISLPFCKARIYFVLIGLTISRYLLCLISIDRWMTTSRNVRIRQLSSPKIARRLIIGAVLFLISINLPISIGYVIDKISGCGPSTEPIYSLFYTIYNIILSLAPLFILTIFSLLTLVNIRHIGHRQILPTTQITLNTHTAANRERRHNNKDIQFIKLSLIQVAAYVIFNTLHGYTTIDAVITQNQIQNADQIAIAGFLNGLGLNLHYTYTGITFFLYTLASATFRKECIAFCKQWSERLLHLI